MDFPDLLTRTRALCQDLPEAEEYLMHDHPSFRAGKKCFVILGDGANSGEVTMSITVDLMDQPLYLEDPRFSRTHYIGQHGWVTMHLSRGFAWEELAHRVVQSYRRAATKRALKALDARVPV